ncbi:AraC family transcriptional regulator [Fibrisoma montanum]|uniref:AraC family transcriptional regulator n=1 Tax=Fibrisoma montanum TaxID=2305895 RepID=A0A418M8R3_9BACT|nr:AraC family transcriptional regulator [Fibrisoma montanum]RIV22473.1 AraC family transcriptional regulator [Fibrisoma montanum]
MLTERLYQPFDIRLMDVVDWHQPPHQHAFFELLYIQDGVGRQCINQNKFAYRKGNLFLVTPTDCHSLDVDAPTQFVSIRFTEQFFQTVAGERPDWFRKLEYVLAQHAHQPDCLLHNDSDRLFAGQLINGLVREYVNKGPFYETILQNGLQLLLNIVARNVAEKGHIGLPGNIASSSMLKDMTLYIQQHIHEPDKLRADHLADRFNLSPTYIGEYFRKHTGESLQSYIIRYKLKLVENRLEFSDLTVSQIADELGFTDESHLSKLFRKYYSISPKMYRQRATAFPA